MRRVTFLQDIGDRKAGSEHELDDALAQHYVDARKVAKYVEAPAPVEDRMIGGTPRGRRRSAEE